MPFRIRALTALLASLLLPAALPANDEPAETPAAEPAASSGRTLVVPMNLALRATEEVEPGLEPVWKELVAHLRDRQPPVAVLGRAGAVTVWNEVMAELGDEPREGKVYEAYARFARRIAEQADFERIVLPSVVTRVAKVRGHTANWDGIDRDVAIPVKAFEDVPSLKSEFYINRRGADGELAAASLYVAVLSPEGELLFEGAGGLALLQRVQAANPYEQDTSLEVVARENAFANPEELRKGIEIAFRKPLPASRRR